MSGFHSGPDPRRFRLIWIVSYCTLSVVCSLSSYSSSKVSSPSPLSVSSHHMRGRVRGDLDTVSYQAKPTQAGSLCCIASIGALGLDHRGTPRRRDGQTGRWFGLWLHVTRLVASARSLGRPGASASMRIRGSVPAELPRHPVPGRTPAQSPVPSWLFALPSSGGIGLWEAVSVSGWVGRCERMWVCVCVCVWTDINV